MNGERIGVFVCSWGSGKEMRLDMDALRDFSGAIDGVVVAKKVDRICSKPGQKEMVSAIKESGIDRFVTVACSERTKTPLYRSIAVSSGLHPLAFEVANAREQAAYVHDIPESQKKAEVLIRMAVEKIRLWTAPPFEEEMPVSNGVAVIGGGLMAISVTSDLLAHGMTVDLVISDGALKEPPLYIFRNEDEEERARRATVQATSDKNLRLHKNSKILEVQGLPGDFGLVLESEGGMVPLRCGAMILAPEPSVELRRVDGSPAPTLNELRDLGARDVVILPGGASSGLGCSCITPRGILYALSLARGIPGTQVSLLGREIRALGWVEELQRAAQEMGIRFFHIDSEPKVEGSSPSWISWSDPLLGETRLPADLVLVDAVLTPEVQAISEAFEVPMDEKGELLCIDSRLHPGETVRKGVFAARYRVGNMLYEDLLTEARAVAGRALELLSCGTMEIGGAVAEIDQEKCSACLTCLRICPYSAPELGEKGKAEIRIELCQGCGSCVGLCPSRAIDIYCFSDSQLVAQSKAALRRGE
jgi:heterodisulfide reductase subunit A